MTVVSGIRSGVALAEVLAAHAATLAAAGLASPAVDLELLAEHALRIDRRHLHTLTAIGGGEVPEPSVGELAELDRLVTARAGRVPLQLLLGRTWFRNLELLCAEGVFIPRPETEIVAGHAIAAAVTAVRAMGIARVVEPCTGTAAIALAIATEVAGAEVMASDRSEAAVALARRNLVRAAAGEAGPAGLAADASCDIEVRDLAAAVPEALLGRVDVLVCNPPYLPAADAPDLAPEVADHDPYAALFGGPDGHEPVRFLIGLAMTALTPGGTLVIEIDDRRGAETAQDARDAGLVDAVIHPDLTGRDRVLVARRPAATDRPGTTDRPGPTDRPVPEERR